MDLMSFLIDDALVLIPVLYVLGLFLKASSVSNKYIPMILLVISLAFSVFLIGFGVEAIIQGVLVAGAAVFADQLVKQAKRED